MRRVLVLYLFISAATALLAAPIVPGIFNGYWSVTNARTDLVAFGPMSIVYPGTGKPLVYWWAPIEVQDQTTYIEYSRHASQPTRRSILWTVSRVARLHGAHHIDEEQTETISGTLRVNGEGRGSFSTERFVCNLEAFHQLIPQQRNLFDVYHMPCPLLATNGIILTNLIPILPPPPRWLTNPPPIRVTNFPPIIPPTNWPPIIIGSNIFTVRTNLPAVTNIMLRMLPTNVVIWDGTIYPPPATNTSLFDPELFDGGVIIIELPSFNP